MELSSVSRFFSHRGRPSGQAIAISAALAVALGVFSALAFKGMIPHMPSSLNIPLGSVSVGMGGSLLFLPAAIRVLKPPKSPEPLEAFYIIGEEKKADEIVEGFVPIPDAKQEVENQDLSAYEGFVSDTWKVLRDTVKLGDREIQSLNIAKTQAKDCIKELTPLLSTKENYEEIGITIGKIEEIIFVINEKLWRYENKHYSIKNDGYVIPDNGNCLFDSFRVYLELKQEIIQTVEQLRKEAVEWIRKNRFSDNKLRYYLVQAVSEHFEKKLLPMDEDAAKKEAAEISEAITDFANLIATELITKHEEDPEAVLIIGFAELQIKDKTVSIEEYINEYLKDMSLPNVFGGACEIYALCHIYKLSAKILQKEGALLIESKTYPYALGDEKSNKVIELIYEKAHYQPKA